MLRSLPPSYLNVPEVQVEVRANYMNLEQPKNAKGTPQTNYTSLTGMDPPSTYDVIPDSSKSKEASQQAQVQHGNLERPKNAKGMPQQTDYTSLTGMDPPSMYDVIPDSSKSKEASQHEPGVTGTTASMKPGEGQSAFYTRKDCGMWLMLIFVLVVAFLALILSIGFRVIPVCDCPNSKLAINLWRNNPPLAIFLSPSASASFLSASLYPSFPVLLSLSLLPLLIVT